MDFASALTQAKPQVGVSCHTGLLLASLSPTERAKVQAALDDPNVSSAHLSRAFSLMGHKLTDGAVRRHRVGECRCEPR